MLGYRNHINQNVGGGVSYNLIKVMKVFFGVWVGSGGWDGIGISGSLDG